MLALRSCDRLRYQSVPAGKIEFRVTALDCFGSKFARTRGRYSPRQFPPVAIIEDCINTRRFFSFLQVSLEGRRSSLIVSLARLLSVWTNHRQVAPRASGRCWSRDRNGGKQRDVDYDHSKPEPDENF